MQLKVFVRAGSLSIATDLLDTPFWSHIGLRMQILVLAGREADSGSSRAGGLGGVAELPPGSQLDAVPGEALHCPHS